MTLPYGITTAVASTLVGQSSGGEVPKASEVPLEIDVYTETSPLQTKTSLTTVSGIRGPASAFDRAVNRFADAVVWLGRKWEYPTLAPSVLLGCHHGPFPSLELEPRYGFNLEIARDLRPAKDINKKDLWCVDPNDKAEQLPAVSLSPAQDQQRVAKEIYISRGLLEKPDFKIVLNWELITYLKKDEMAAYQATIDRFRHCDGTHPVTGESLKLKRSQQASGSTDAGSPDTGEHSQEIDFAKEGGAIFSELYAVILEVCHDKNGGTCRRFDVEKDLKDILKLGQKENSSTNCFIGAELTPFQEMPDKRPLIDGNTTLRLIIVDSQGKPFPGDSSMELIRIIVVDGRTTVSLPLAYDKDRSVDRDGDGDGESFVINGVARKTQMFCRNDQAEIDGRTLPRLYLGTQIQEVTFSRTTTTAEGNVTNPIDPPKATHLWIGKDACPPQPAGSGRFPLNCDVANTIVHINATPANLVGEKGTVQFCMESRRRFGGGTGQFEAPNFNPRARLNANFEVDVDGQR